MDIEEMAEEICKHSNEAELKERAARKKSSSSLEEDTIESSEEEEDEEEEESDSDYEKDIEDVIKGLPEYFFKTPREKKKYFGKLNDEYRKKMKVPKRTQSKTEGDKKVKINVKSNQTFEFYKKDKIRKDSSTREELFHQPIKSLLKRRMIVEE
eukprot:TRINITY_DN3278_c0_g1_i2.p2 TRINITY_DN3278_c0_g1~~TRINITY_DN3278_c0_g1_i2.p2  ORF type:complete len:154 (-),score=58.67 TRINITY_DN3278_c0_g1_i2:142-603(-)